MQPPSFHGSAVANRRSFLDRYLASSFPSCTWEWQRSRQLNCLSGDGATRRKEDAARSGASKTSAFLSSTWERGGAGQDYLFGFTVCLAALLALFCLAAALAFACFCAACLFLVFGDLSPMFSGILPRCKGVDCSHFSLYYFCARHQLHHAFVTVPSGATS